MSDIRYDPGDLAELRASQAGRLSPDAVERLVRAAKQVEVIAPNLPLLYNLPAVDGYDGGLLPLNRYVQFQSLFLPPELLLPDGRLREQLRGVMRYRLIPALSKLPPQLFHLHSALAGDLLQRQQATGQFVVT